MFLRIFLILTPLIGFIIGITIKNHLDTIQKERLVAEHQCQFLQGAFYVVKTGYFCIKDNRIIINKEY
jgi:hypothetical protein